MTDELKAVIGRLKARAIAEDKAAGGVQGPSFRGSEWGADIIAANRQHASDLREVLATLSSRHPGQPQAVAFEQAWLNAEGRIAELEEALRPFANRVPLGAFNGQQSDDAIVAKTGMELGHFRRARQALSTLSLEVGSAQPDPWTPELEEALACNEEGSLPPFALHESWIAEEEDGPVVGLLIDRADGLQVWSGEVSLSALNDMEEDERSNLGNSSHSIVVGRNDGSPLQILGSAVSIDAGATIVRAIAKSLPPQQSAKAAPGTSLPTPPTADGGGG